MNSLYKALYAHGPSTDRPMATARLLFAGRADALAASVLADYQEQQRINMAPPEPDVAPPTGMDDNPFDTATDNTEPYSIGNIPDAAFKPLLDELRPDQADLGRLGISVATSLDPEAMKKLEYAHV